jgi:tetratricopeptide (TPR) repeat protein
VFKRSKIIRLIQAGDDLLAQGLLDPAEGKYRLALKIDPNSAEALYSMGCVASHRKDYASGAEWSRRALAKEEGHRNARLLLGNCLLGLQHYEAAKKELEKSLSDKPRIEVLTQIALCDEGLGGLDAAETRLRELMERFPSYVSRFQPIGMFAYGALPADLHSHLARVLQKKGDIQEAKLHYHLSKRCDATIELDPLYREIMSDADLGDHPYFDSHAAGEPSDPLERWLWIAHIDNHDELFDALKDRGVERHLSQLVTAITVTQDAGHFYLSARLRYAGDVLTGKSSPSFFAALISTGWKRLFETAERVQRGEIAEAQAVEDIDELDIEPSSLPQLIALTQRFVELQPQTGAVLAWSLVNATRHGCAGDERLRALALAGEAFERSGNIGRSAETFSLLAAEAANAGRTSFEMQAIRSHARLLAGQNRFIDALALLDPATDRAKQTGDPVDVVHALADKAVILLHAGRADDALDTCRALLREHKTALTALPSGRLRDLVTAAARGQIPDDLSDSLDALGDGDAGSCTSETVDELMQRGTDAAAAERWDEALGLFEQAERTAWDVSDWAGSAEAVVAKARVLAQRGDFKKAANLLVHARTIAERDVSRVNLFALELLSAEIAIARDLHEEAAAFVENAVTAARRLPRDARRAEALRQIAAVLLRLDEQRAVGLMGESIDVGRDTSADPQELQEAAVAFQNGDWDKAARCYELFLNRDNAADSVLERRAALVNLASALFHLGRHDEWPARIEEAIALARASDDRSGAADHMLRLAVMQHKANQDRSGWHGRGFDQ